MRTRSVRAETIAVGFSRRLALMVILVAFAGALQATDLAVIGSVKVNLPLAALAAFSFLAPSLAWYLTLLIVAGFFVRFAPGFDLPLLAFTGVALGAFAASRLAPITPLLGAPLTAAVATVALYLIIDPAFVGETPLTVLAELFYNALVAVLCYFAAVAVPDEK